MIAKVYSIKTSNINAKTAVIVNAVAHPTATINTRDSELHPQHIHWSTKNAATLYKKGHRRLDIPDSYPSWSESKELSAVMDIAGFERENDPIIFEKVLKALQKDSLSAIVDRISIAFNCDPSEVCLLHARTVTRKNIKTPVVYLYYTYNPSFNVALKGSTDYATFNGSIKAWSIELCKTDKAALSNAMSSFYSVIIDLNSLVIMRNQSRPLMAFKAGVAFSLMPFHLSVTRHDVVDAIHCFRTSDNVIEDKIYVHDGESFILFPDEDIIWTQYPFLLLRYTVIGGQPRYASLSTIGKAVEQITFGNRDKKTAKLIARFIAASRYTNKSVITDEYSEIIHATPIMLNKLRGDFDRYAMSISTIRNAIPDIHFSLLCSDYVTLMIQKHGADSDDIIAYVYPSLTQKSDYLRRIASFFGDENTDYPIIFTRSVLDQWDDAEDMDFILTMSHELAHWLVLEKEWEFSDEDSGGHGIAWAVCQDVLEYVFTEEYTTTAYRSYHKDDIETSARIEDVVTNIGIDLLERSRCDHQLSKADIKNVTHACMSSLSDCLERVIAHNEDKKRSKNSDTTE